MSLQFIAIIPARYASTRFPGKPLALLHGKPVIQHVYEQVNKAVDNVWVATDDERIMTTVKEFGGNAVMTRSDHKSGTDRIREAYEKIGNGRQIVINVQGDEPFIREEQIDAIKQCFGDSQTDIATLVQPFKQEDGWEALENPNSPKVVVDQKGFAIYFSRSVIPYCRGKEKQDWLKTFPNYYKHIGMYAYKPEVLKAITELKQSPLELAESLEQLRWLENGYKIKVSETDIATIGIDTPEDLERAEAFLRIKS